MRLLYFLFCAFPGPCKTDWHYYEGSCYLFQINGDDNKKSWEDATDACANEGAGLVRIGSKDEDDFILAKFEELNSGTTDLFIFTAGNDQVEEGRWIWSGRSGTMSETMQYRNWIGDEPNNLEGNENCLALWPIHKGWFDISCSGKNYYICED